ncbi:hypothetical protein ADUPG1_002922 [Aduncisulcus paluster]|uniref:Uncharacterized protein n=1 Tax=Aduncisulcus paluster TaxID=2918883 RepID=A0ABQ5KRI4_9EUKA|nr:hypothetical protein ADUPG1_002922 [Aduncisulcus paluster]
MVSGLIRNTCRPVQTRFRYGYTSLLNLALQINSLAHYAKGKWSQNKSAPTACATSAVADFGYEAFTLYDAPSQTPPLSKQITHCGPTTPHARKHTVWANPSSLAATLGISLCIQLKDNRGLLCWVSPFGNPWVKAYLAANHGISQPITSFIAS